jgi:hypothetical protein
MKDKLKALRELLTPETSWTKGAVARDKEGKSVGTAAHPDATCFCLIGGVQKVCPSDYRERRDMFTHLERAIRQRFQNRDHEIEFFNDNPETTHGDVLTVIDFAVAHAW